MAQNLDARKDGRLKAFDLSRHGNFLQNAVNPVTDSQFVLERLQMDVRSAQLDGVGQNLIDKLDDGSVLGGIVQICIFDAGFIHDLQRGDVVERVDCVGSDAEPPLDFAADCFVGSKK